jgi:hypothetical protein
MDGLFAFAALITAQFFAVLYVHRWYAAVPRPDMDGGSFDGTPKSRSELLHTWGRAKSRASV